MRKYKELYWSDAILLADEVLRRLPKQKRQANILGIYQHPANVLGVQTVADHLELIAKLLPDYGTDGKVERLRTQKKDQFLEQRFFAVS